MIRTEHYKRDPEAEKSHVVSDLRAFPWKYFEGLGDKTQAKGINDLFRDLQSGRFWGVLTRLDGPVRIFSVNAPTLLGSEKVNLAEQRSLAREWAKANFDERQLEKLFEMCVGVALTVPFETSWPATRKGHSILYDQLYTAPDSIFRQYVPEDFSVQLNNGRFWEELPQVQSGVNFGLSAHVVDDVLVNHFDDLDPASARFGYTLFERNGGDHLLHDIGQLSRDGRNAYRTFMGMLESAEPDIRLQPDQLARLNKRAR